MKKKSVQGTIFCIILILLMGCGPKATIEQLSHTYIQKWRSFYPSLALAAGDEKAAFAFEDPAPQKISDWLHLNRDMLAKLENMTDKDSLTQDDRIDMRLLKRQIQQELETWAYDRPHIQSANYYSELISQAMTHILARNTMNPAETLRAVSNRLAGINSLCQAGVKHLNNGSPIQTNQSVARLERTAGFYQTKLAEIGIIQKWLDKNNEKDFKKETAHTAVNIRRLAKHIKTIVSPAMTLPDAMGKENYNRKLKIYTDSRLNAHQLFIYARQEIEDVRRLMAVSAAKYWETTQPDHPKPTHFDELMQYALTAMESHRANNQQEFLEQFQRLIIEAETFVKEKKIATITGNRTIFTALSPPHFAGAAVGGVYPAGPFQPEADTLFYLPTVPDSAPTEVKEGFYRSFNNHFNMMIITHEIVPGHYWHLKQAAKHKSPVRSLFGGDVYAEGWATLCEQITLEYGWGNHDELTYLAHLRKRLENAVRAYTSLNVHCNGWTRKQMIDFAVETGLLAPQFAANLWNRVIFSPHQLTSYFLGYREFDRVLTKQEKRLGKDFSMTNFCDAILFAGAMPMDMVEAFLVN